MAMQTEGVPYTWEGLIAMAQAGPKMTPVGSPVPMFPFAVRYEGGVWKSKHGKGEAAPRISFSMPKLDYTQLHKRVSLAKLLRHETIRAGNQTIPCYVVEVQYEPGFPFKDSSPEPQRLWIDMPRSVVLRHSFATQNDLLPEEKRRPLRWTVAFDSVKLNEAAPQWLADLYSHLAEEKGERLGQLAPDFTLPDLTGRQVHLARLRGTVVLLNFWASYCGPCKEEMPVLEKLRTEFQWKAKALETKTPAKSCNWLIPQLLKLRHSAIPRVLKA
jgi:thiol-disulfide isomerase/thioredoxin